MCYFTEILGRRNLTCSEPQKRHSLYPTRTAKIDFSTHSVSLEMTQRQVILRNVGIGGKESDSIHGNFMQNMAAHPAKTAKAPLSYHTDEYFKILSC